VVDIITQFASIRGNGRVVIVTVRTATPKPLDAVSIDIAQISRIAITSD